jgi:hypothetical protein
MEREVGFGIAASVFFVGGLMLLCLGVLGEYLGRVYDEVRSRPLSIIDNVYGSPRIYSQRATDVSTNESALSLDADNGNSEMRIASRERRR